MHQQHVTRRQRGQQIFRAAVEAPHGLAFQPSRKILGERKAQVRPPRLDFHEARAFHRGLQAAADGFDFGKFGHVAVI